MTKNLYFDTETTGLDPRKNGLIQLAMIIEIDGQVKEEVNLKLKPHDLDIIDDEALKVNGITREMLENDADRLSLREGYLELIKILAQYVNQYDSSDKFIPIGYNVSFDMDVLKHFFLKNGDKYFGSWVWWNIVDPLPVLRFLRYSGKIDLQDYKLSTVCSHFGINIDAHDALSDITATRELTLLLREKYKDLAVL